MEIIYKIFKIAYIRDLTVLRLIDGFEEQIFRNVFEDLPDNCANPPKSEHKTENDALKELAFHPYFKANEGNYIIQKIYKITKYVD